MSNESTKPLSGESLAWLNQALFEIGDFSISLFALIYVFSLLALLYIASNQARRLIMRRLERRGFFNPSIETVLALGHYFIVFIGTLIVLQSAGMDLSALAVLAGAVGIGLGFGLQNVTNNFISGLIIMFERPIKVGDRVEIGKITGQVVRIGIRSTTVLTNDNISTIIPNSDFVSDQVVNWSHTDDIVRIRIPIGVSYHADPKKVIEALQEVVDNTPGVLRDRRSDVILDSFGDSSVNYLIRVWTQDFAKRPGAMRHQINMAIWEALKKAKIEIPFPQLDLHLRSSALKKEELVALGAESSEQAAPQE